MSEKKKNLKQPNNKELESLGIPADPKFLRPYSRTKPPINIKEKTEENYKNWSLSQENLLNPKYTDKNQLLKSDSINVLKNSIEKTKKEINNLSNIISKIDISTDFYNGLEKKKEKKKKLPFPIKPPFNIESSSNVENQLEYYKKTIKEFAIENEKDSQLISALQKQIKELLGNKEIIEKKNKKLKLNLEFNNIIIEGSEYGIEKLINLVKNKNFEIEFDNGLYVGCLMNELPHLYGEWHKVNNIDSYRGCYNNGIRNGFGISNTKGIGMYKGEWKMNEKSGKGIFKYENGDLYEGSWLKNKKHGNGTYEFSDGTKYVGLWGNDLKNGNGKIYHSNGDNYTGNFEKDEYNGIGHFICYDYEYKGNWKNGLENGEGHWLNIDGDTYEGKWVDGKKYGYGTYTHREGWVYKGDWKDNKKNGNGILSYYFGDQYEGNWENDHREGHGKYTYSNKDNYIGNWHLGLAHGKGKYVFEDEAMYEGNFVKGLPHGEGVFTFPSGQKVERTEWNELLPEGYDIRFPWQKTL